MSPVSRRTGRRYAAGSQATFDGYPRVCSGCGEKVKITGDRPLWFESSGVVKRSYHADCYLSGAPRPS